MAEYSKRGNWRVWSFQPPKGWNKTYNDDGVAEHNGSNADDNPYDWYVDMNCKTFTRAFRTHCELYKRNNHCNLDYDYEAGYLLGEDNCIKISKEMWRNPEGARKHFQTIADEYDAGITVELVEDERFKQEYIF